MALKFTGRRWHDDKTGTVTFPAWSDATRVQCRITDESLMLLFGAVRTDTGLLSRRSIAISRQSRSPLPGSSKRWPDSPQSRRLAPADFPDRKPAPSPDIKKLDPDEMRARMDQLRRTRPSDQPDAGATMVDAIAASCTFETEGVGEESESTQVRQIRASRSTSDDSPADPLQEAALHETLYPCVQRRSQKQKPRRLQSGGAFG